MMNKKHVRNILLISAACLLLITALVLLLKKAPDVRPLRMRWSAEETGGNATLTFQSHKISGKKNRLTIRRKKEISTLRGLSAKRNITLEPGLAGRYIMDFFALLAPGGVLRQQDRRGEIVRDITLDAHAEANSFQRFQLSLDLQKDHVLELRVPAESYGFIGRPVFYPPVKEKERQFVFLVMADTLRWDRLGVYNASMKTSPRIDDFARDGVVFTQAYSTAPWTLPAHMSLFTGLFPDKHQVHYGNDTLPKGVKPLPEELQNLFMTYSFNESHFVSARFGFDRGFDIYTEMQDTRPRAKTKRLFDKARQWVKMEKSGHAFFFLHTYQLHHPYYPEIKPANEYYKYAGFKGFSRNLVSIYDFIGGGRDIYRDAPEEEKTAVRRVYEAGVYTFDFRFGQFLDFLKQQGIYERSMIILISDHGEEFRDHGGWEHSHSLYNELIKIPLIIKFPGNQYAGRAVDRPASITDVLPAVLDIYKVEGQAEQQADQRRAYPIDGRSIVEIMNSEEGGKRFLLSYLAPNALRIVPQKIALISGGLKFIFNKPRKEKDISFFKTTPPQTPAYEIFDIFNDPGDQSNIIDGKRKWLRLFIQHIKTLKFKKGKKGFLKGMEKDLKTLGYL